MVPSDTCRLLRKAALVPVIAVVAGLMPASATAQTSRQACGPRALVVERLAEGYGETRRSIGIGSNNAVVEVFASDDSGTWTITMTTPQGITCLIASGQAFETLMEALPTDDQDA